MENLFSRYSGFRMYNGGIEHLIYPFNRDTFLETDMSNPVAHSPLLEKVSSKDGKDGVGMLRGISRIFDSTFTEISLKGFGGYGIDEDGNVILDYWDGVASEFNLEVGPAITSGLKELNMARNRHILFRMGKDFLEASVIDEYGGETPYKIQTTKEAKDTHSPSALVALLLAYCLEFDGSNDVADEIKKTFKLLLGSLDGSARTPDIKCSGALTRRLSDSLYSIMKYTETFDLPFNSKMFTNEYLRVPFEDIKVKKFTGSSQYFGSAKKTAAVKTKNIKIIKNIKNLIDEKIYDLGVKWSEEERKLIPSDCDNVVLSDVATTSLNALKATWGTKLKFWSHCWYGPSGTGKSTDARAFAQAIGFPYYPQALSDSTYADDLLMTKTVNTEETSKKDFKDVPSPLFLAYTKGGVCELVEANAAKPAQMKILNSMLDDTGKIYIDGNVYERNPNFVLIATMNYDEGTEGVHTLSRDFVQRFHIGGMYKEISDEQIKQRIKNKTLLKDDSIINKMIKVFHSMQKICLEEGDSHDFVGLRQIYDWAQLAALTGQPYQSAQSTMIGLGSFNEEMQEELISALRTQFTELDDGEHPFISEEDLKDMPF